MISSCDVLQHFLEFCQAYVFGGMLIHNTRSHKHMKIHNKSCNIFIVSFKHPSVVTLLRHHSLPHPAGITTVNDHDLSYPPRRKYSKI